MTSATTLTFVCGVAVGLCSAFILMTIVSARRRRHYGIQAWHAGFTAPRAKRNDEPTELDQ
jgi:hypothetical protein